MVWNQRVYDPSNRTDRVGWVGFSVEEPLDRNQQSICVCYDATSGLYHWAKKVDVDMGSYHHIRLQPEYRQFAPQSSLRMLLDDVAGHYAEIRRLQGIVPDQPTSPFRAQTRADDLL